ncbi:MAG: alanine dehydrogenase [Waddliaceae bacterium]
MLIGIPKEIKDHEYRIGATPAMARTLIEAGHQVIIEKDAGASIGYSNEIFEAVGAKIVPTAEDVWKAEMIIKVKEPQKSEFPLMHEGQILFCYLHLAPDPEQTAALLEKKVIGIAYETVTNDQGRLPLLTPMSEIAGRVAIQAGAVSLQLNNGGKGVLLGGVPGVLPGKVVVIGGGAVGTESVRMALGLGARVVVLDKSIERLQQLDFRFGPHLQTLHSSSIAIEEVLSDCDLLVGAVLVPGGKAPKLITRELLRQMSPGSVFVDVAIDQGGCSETSRPTSHGNPTYVEEGIVHYCVTNMPGACASTATRALTNATSLFALKIANLGYKKACLEDPHLRNGLNVCLGHVTNMPVAQDLGFTYVPPEGFLS